MSISALSRFFRNPVVVFATTAAVGYIAYKVAPLVQSYFAKGVETIPAGLENKGVVIISPQSEASDVSPTTEAVAAISAPILSSRIPTDLTTTSTDAPTAQVSTADTRDEFGSPVAEYHANGFQPDEEEEAPEDFTPWPGFENPQQLLVRRLAGYSIVDEFQVSIPSVESSDTLEIPDDEDSPLRLTGYSSDTDSVLEYHADGFQPDYEEMSRNNLAFPVFEDE